MRTFIVALFFVALASAELDNINFIQRHKRADSASVTCEERAANCCKSGEASDCKDCSSLIIDKSELVNFDKYANDYLIRSFEYLFLSAQFGTHLRDRPGFEKVLHGLADGAWNKGFEIIKEVTKRGGNHSFEGNSIGSVKVHGNVNEVQALSKAVEIEKNLLTRANYIHRHHSHATLNEDHAKGYDAGIAHFLEEEIIEDKTETVRKLVGHVNDLKNLFRNNADLFPMSLYLFDQYLQK